MYHTKTVRSYAMLAAFAALGLASCSNKATEEQMKTLGELDRQREGLRGDLQRSQSDLRDAQGKLANAQRDLSDCNTDTQAASAMLQKWPDVWPDSVEWRLAPPPAPVPEKTGKKSKR
jgi:hypothetical protein